VEEEEEEEEDDGLSFCCCVPLGSGLLTMNEERVWLEILGGRASLQ
jgi:hypothetical protein